MTNVCVFFYVSNTFRPNDPRSTNYCKCMLFLPPKKQIMPSGQGNYIVFYMFTDRQMY